MGSFLALQQLVLMAKRHFELVLLTATGQKTGLSV